MAISLVKDPTYGGTIDLVRPNQVLPDELLVERGDRAVYAANGRIDNNEILQSVFAGYENYVRNNLSTQKYNEHNNSRISLITQISRQAAEQGRQINEVEQEMILSLTGPEAASPSVVLERLYADRFLEELNTPDDPVFDEAYNENPEAATQVYNATRDHLTRRGIAQTVLEETLAKMGDKNLLQLGLDFGKGLIPLASYLNMSNRVGQTGEFWLGENIHQQRQALYLLPIETFEQELRRAVSEIEQWSVFDAMQFASAMVAYGETDAAFDNVFTGLDVFDVAITGVSTGLAVSRYANVARKASQSLPSGATTIARQVAQGNVADAARTAAENRLSRIVPNKQSEYISTSATARVDEIIGQVPDLLNPEGFYQGQMALPQERANRLVEAASRDRDLLLASMVDIPVVERLPEQARLAAFAKEEARFISLFPNLEDSIVNFKRIEEATESFGGVDQIAVQIGTKDGLPFKSAANAEFFANKWYRLDGYEIVQEGNNFLIQVTRSVREDDVVTNLERIKTDYPKPATILNTFLNLLGSADNLESRAAMVPRKVATYAGNAVMARLGEVTKSIGRLSHSEHSRLSEILDAARFQTREVVLPDGTVDKVQGRFYHNQYELETEYLNRFNVLPTEKESRAYVAFRQLMDFDYLQRNATVLRDKQRLGIEELSITIPVPQETGGTRLSRSEYFEGRFVEELPPVSSGDYTVGVFNSTTGKTQTFLRGRQYREQRNELDELIASGDYRIIQLADSNNRQLGEAFKSFSAPLDYIVVKNVRNRPIKSVQVPYNQGGHWMYNPNDHFLKQPQTHKDGFGRRIYNGDTTLHSFPAGAQGRQFREAYETARQMLAEVLNTGNWKALDAFVQSNLPYRSGRDFAKLFKSKGNPEGVFDVNTPFVLTQSGQRSADVLPFDRMFAEPVVDSSKSAHNLGSRIGTEFTQQRNERLTTVINKGTEQSPYYSLTGAPMLNSMEALGRSQKRVAQSRVLDDLKHRSVENWVNQFGSVLDGNLAEIRANPMAFLRNPKYLTNADRNLVQHAKTVRRNLLTFFQTRTDADNIIRWSQNKMADIVFGAAGNKGLQIVEPLLWNARTDPVTMARSAVFNVKMGLLNWVQLPLQASAATMALAIDGNVVRASRAPLLFWGLRTRGLAEGNARGQGHISKQISKALGMSEEYLDEAYDTWRRIGAHVIEGEHSQLDDWLNPGMLSLSPSNLASASGIKQAGKQFLNMGQTFFREGNQVHRGTAFALAFQRWRDANPTKRIDNKALAEITDRMDLLYLRMSRASNAAWQGGTTWLQQLASTPAQFFAFQARLADLMLGKQLTLGEKGRLLGMNAILWGVPTGVAGTTLGAFWNWGDHFRQGALESGYDPATASGVEKAFHEGLVSVMINQMLGIDVDTSRYAPGGLDWAGNLLNGDLMELAGAGPNFIKDMIGLTSPVFRSIVSVFSESDEEYTLTLQDGIDALREISSVNQTAQAWLVYNTGMYWTKKGGEVLSMEQGDAMSALAIALGLTPQEVTDTYLKMDSIRSHDEARRVATQEALQNFERGLRAAENRDEALMRTYFQRAYFILQMADLNAFERGEVFRDAMRTNQPLVEKIDMQFIQRFPTEQED